MQPPPPSPLLETRPPRLKILGRDGSDGARPGNDAEVRPQELYSLGREPALLAVGQNLGQMACAQLGLHAAPILRAKQITVPFHQDGDRRCREGEETRKFLRKNVVRPNRKPRLGRHFLFVTARLWQFAEIAIG